MTPVPPTPMAEEVILLADTVVAVADVAVRQVEPAFPPLDKVRSQLWIVPDPPEKLTVTPEEPVVASEKIQPLKTACPPLNVNAAEFLVDVPMMLSNSRFVPDTVSAPDV